MKKIIPFKKELPFNTTISEITSISLEHTLNLEEENIVSGEFHISGEYKMTNISLNKEPFDFNIPFDIALDARYDVNNLVIDIDDFYYEIVNNENLLINIDLFIDGVKLEEPALEEMPREIPEEVLEERCIEEENELEQNIVYQKIMKESLIEDNNETNINDDNNDDVNIFDTSLDKETYVTYHVYIVKEEDTIEKILAKYNVTKEQLESYNEIKELKIGDKLIIPSVINND